MKEGLSAIKGFFPDCICSECKTTGTQRFSVLLHDGLHYFCEKCGKRQPWWLARFETPLPNIPEKMEAPA